MNTKITNYINDIKPNYKKHSNVDDFKNHISKSYNKKSNKQLKYSIYNLLSITKDNKPISDINSYSKYFKFNDMKKGITTDNIKINDKNSHFLLKQDKKQSSKALAKTKYTQYNNIDSKKFYITFTCPSSHNYYTKKGTRKNPNCIFNNLEECIEASLILQRQVNNYFYRQLQKYLKRKDLGSADFIRSLEPSQGLVIHSHSIYFLQDNEAIKTAKHIFQQVKNKFNLKMVDKKVLKDDKQVTNYVVKYITKTLFSGADTPFHTQYKRYFSKYRFFSSSKFKNNTSQIKLDKVYIYLSKNYPELLKKFISDKEIPLYIHLENYINEKVVFETKTTEYIQTNYKKIYKQIDSLKMVDLNSNYIVEHIEFNLCKFQNTVLKKSIDLAYDKDTGEVIYINDYKMGEKIDKKQLVNMIKEDE